MKKLIEFLKDNVNTNSELPYSLISSFKEQYIVDVPISKPLLVFVLKGTKHLGKNDEIIIEAGNFIFLSNSIDLDMRNIPNREEYLAMLIEFEYGDFKSFALNSKTSKKSIQGEITESLVSTLLQFVEWANFAPRSMWNFRREEILHFLNYLGPEDVSSIFSLPSLSHKVEALFNEDQIKDIGVDFVCAQLGVSESTLRRKLKQEGSSFQEIKDRSRLGKALFLIQTTREPVGIIAGMCGFQSQSRFTEKFKKHFKITPTELRNTRVKD
jgi:AraC-like DNA-binding protein